MQKVNCWEFRNCGRQPGGQYAEELGVCPAATENGRDGINGGTNGGRCCWTIGGTYCFGEVQGTFARKFDDCMECEFFWVVADEEENFMPSVGTLPKDSSAYDPKTVCRVGLRSHPGGNSSEKFSRR